MITLTTLTGSVRPGRFNTQPARWIHEFTKRLPDVRTQYIDIQDLSLPFYDEPGSPSAGTEYIHEHTKKWSKIVAATDGFIFVTPEYNHSYSPVLKNALDFLYREWNHKPVAFVGYGGLAAGSRAVEHLRTVVAELKMYDLREHILLPSYWEHLDANGRYQFTEHQNKTALAMVKELAFWSGIMQRARIEK